MATHTILSDFLRELGVPHTRDYADMRFATMTFKSLYGFSKVLGDYGIASEALRFEGRKLPTDVPLPSLAQFAGRFVILTAYADGMVRFIQDGVRRELTVEEFERHWSGIIFIAYPEEGRSAEPSYGHHRFLELAGIAKRVVLAACVIFISLYAMTVNGLWSNWATIALVILDLAGIYISSLLVLKSAKIHTRAAERVCGVLQKGGCDHVLEQKASSFFGLFGWSEVGLAYFLVSYVALIAFPQSWGILALLNACCLPFTVWSIWYQRTRAKAWCTLCVTVQCLLWLEFFCYLGGGMFGRLTGAGWPLLLVLAAYAAALFGINALTPLIDRSK